LTTTSTAEQTCVKIGINGFGRIGRAVAKIAAERSDLHVVAINELNNDLDNAIYLYNYDTTYGRANVPLARGDAENTVNFGTKTATFHHCRDVKDVPWEAHDIDIVIDSSGVSDNVAGCRALVGAGRVAKTIITHVPDSGVDRFIVMGVNEDEYDPTTDHVVSSVICDTNAIAHVLSALEGEYGIDSGFVTTLHPWLSYQNLVDSPVPWQASPGAYWKDYSLGRSSVGSLIPKNTTAVTCLATVMPDVEQKLRGFSYRVPTDVVCSADLTLTMSESVTLEQVTGFLRDRFAGSPFVTVNDDALVSVDFKGMPQSAVLDARWLQVLDNRMIKLILWYDNEWGYSNRVIDITTMMAKALKAQEPASNS
jgi:glyceraldehyde 3-phosphate dehydrogenase